MADDDICGACNQPRKKHTGYEETSEFCSGFCPGPFCPECSGEHCNIHGHDPCNCDVLSRHDTSLPSRHRFA